MQYLVFWLQRGTIHTLAHCRGIAGGVSMNRIVMHDSAKGRTPDEVMCDICGSEDPQTTETRDTLDVARVAVRPSVDSSAQERAAAHARSIFRGGSEDNDTARKRSFDQFEAGTIQKPVLVPDRCFCGHSLREHVKSGWDNANYCDECECNNFEAVKINLPQPVLCECGCPESDHRQIAYDGLRWCNIIGCRCLDFVLPGKLRRSRVTAFDDLPEPEPIVLPDPVGYVSPGYEDEEEAA